ncbi:MAG TPA: universal stress protein [Oculatellaceae cyanobacterium]
MARNLGANVKTKIIKGSSAQREILNFANTNQVDLIVLGSNIGQITGRVFFGHAVDGILGRATCPVAVVSSSQ